jgi:hypothetical protein
VEELVAERTTQMSRIGVSAAQAAPPAIDRDGAPVCDREVRLSGA